MQNLQDIEEKIFFECKNILESLSKINSKDELIQKQDLFYEISERISFLKILEKNENSFLELENSTSFNALNDDDHYIEIQDKAIKKFSDEPIEEEVAFTNELNQINEEDEESEVEIIDNDETLVSANEGNNRIENHVENMVVDDEKRSDSSIVEEVLKADADIEVENQMVAETEDDVEVQPTDDKKENFAIQYETESLAQNIEKDMNVSLSEEDNEVINPEELIETPPAFDDNWFDSKKEDEEKIHEKKFKLANIKGLKSLFDYEQLESLEQPTIGSNAKASVSTSYMQADAAKQEFKLDLNDRLAFSKMLFGGSQSELNDTVNQLNQYKNIDQAKEYLSELYYERKWDRVDEYAQRLWTLVENKFM